MGRLKPLGFREIKRRVESAGFQEVSQKESRQVRAVVARTDRHGDHAGGEVPVGIVRSMLSQAHIDADSWDQL